MRPNREIPVSHTQVKQTVSSVKTGAKHNARNSVSPGRHQVRQASPEVYVSQERIRGVNSGGEECKYPCEEAPSKRQLDIIQQWLLDFPLTREQQQMVNSVPVHFIREAVDLGVTADRPVNANELKIENGGRHAPDSSTTRDEFVRERRKQPKHANKNLSKTVASISANVKSINQSSEPEPNVGDVLPTQYRPDVPPRPSKEWRDLMVRGVPIPPDPPSVSDRKSVV